MLGNTNHCVDDGASSTTDLFVYHCFDYVDERESAEEDGHYDCRNKLWDCIVG